ncbi:MAG TPA: hypothetical protein VIK98_07670 [Limnochordales bacterium]
MGGLADRALRFTAADPLRVNVAAPGTDTAYTVLLARCRAVAINKVADSAWRRGKFESAVLAYRHLFARTNILWEAKEDETAEERVEPDPSETVAVAGWRLALWGSLSDGPDRLELLTLLPRRVMASLVRWQHPGYCCTGESVSGLMWVAALLLNQFLEQQGIEIDYRSELPPALRGRGLPRAWVDARQTRFGVRDLLVFFLAFTEGTPMRLWSRIPFSRWLLGQILRPVLVRLALIAGELGVLAWLMWRWLS